MQEIVFTKKKANHFYAKRVDGQLEVVQDPKVGDVVLEVAVVSGGSQ